MLNDIRPISPRPFLAAESPVWDDRRGWAFFVDIKGHALLAWDPETGVLWEWPVAQDIGFVALTGGAELILGLKSGLALFDPETGAMSPLTGFSPPGDERINDGKVAPDGSLYFGTMGDAAEPGKGRLFRLDPALRLTEVASGYGVPNGPAFASDGSFYHCATDAGRIDRHGPEGAEPFILLPTEIGGPDGLALDDAGRLWAGLWGGAGLLVADAAGAYEVLPLPATYVTSMAPVGPDGRTLLITTAASPLLRGARGGLPLEGRVLVARLDTPWRARSCRFGAGA